MEKIEELQGLHCRPRSALCRLDGMAVTLYTVSERGQMALPASARRRWGLMAGGQVEVLDLGRTVVIAPAGPGGLRDLLRTAIEEAGGYDALVAEVIEDEPDLA